MSANFGQKWAKNWQFLAHFLAETVVSLGFLGKNFGRLSQRYDGFGSLGQNCLPWRHASSFWPKMAQGLAKWPKWSFYAARVCCFPCSFFGTPVARKVINFTGIFGKSQTRDKFFEIFEENFKKICWESEIFQDLRPALGKFFTQRGSGIKSQTRAGYFPGSKTPADSGVIGRKFSGPKKSGRGRREYPKSKNLDLEFLLQVRAI